ncbi:MAG: DUF4041 domain-containing protein, partial [Ruminococcus sp.]|nr:DUF4041 domain-containing protein [Ruminococcus sp.]
MFESFGLYTPRFNFAKAEYYKTRLDEIRKRQKVMISEGTAVTGNRSWTVNGSEPQGRKVLKDMQKLLLRAFNSECDDIVEKVKYNNFDNSVKRIRASRDAISKLGAIMSITISEAYLNMKIDELTLANEYAIKKQEEKEAEKEVRARLREEAKLLKEIEEERKRLEKEQTHYQNALAKLNAQLAQNPSSPELNEKRLELEQHIADAEKAIKDVDYREANKRAGYVYVISNVGAFGENVYKIGMTRRLDPQERVDELGDASVPFAFDVHAMIFTDDAPALEAALHRAFEDKKVNMVNPRREFFRVTLDEIKAVIGQNYDKTVEFTDIPDAEQWRISLKMRGETPSQAAPQMPGNIPQAAPAPSMPGRPIAPTTPPRASTPTRTTPPKNLAQTAIDAIRAKYPAAECTYVEKNGIFTVIIKNQGRLRISNWNRIKCDYFGKNGKVAFFGNINSVRDYV